MRFMGNVETGVRRRHLRPVGIPWRGPVRLHQRLRVAGQENIRHTRAHTFGCAPRPIMPSLYFKKIAVNSYLPFRLLCIGTVTSVFSTAQSLSREGSRRSYSGRLGSGFNQCVLDIAWTCAGAEAKAPDLTRLACGSKLPQQRCGTGVARAGFRECHGRRRRADTLPSLKWDPFL